MKILKEKRALIVRPKNPQQLSKLIPTSKLVVEKGRTVVAVPYRLDEVRVLNNLGLKAPSPIKDFYGWPRGGEIKKPFNAQIETASFLTLNPRAFVLNDLGTGKTLAALWAYDYLRSIGRAEKMLVVCPLSTMERAWADELFFHMPHLKYKVLYGTAAKRKKLLSEDADIYIINHHGCKIIGKDICTRDDITHVVVDEVAQVARNKRTDMWKALNIIVNVSQKRTAWGMTATPIPNEPTDAFAQVKLIHPSNAPMYFTAFKQQVMQQVNSFLWVPRPEALDRVDEIMAPAIRYHRSQCVDLPPTIYMTRETQLTKKQEVVYKELRKELVAQVESGEITAVNEAVKVSKLVQVACGAVYDSDKKIMDIDSKPRLELTEEMIKAADTKSIVFVPFVSAVEKVSSYLESKGHKVGVVHGGVNKSKRDEVFRGFQKGSAYDVIVAQPGAMSHGLTLTSASSIIWYAPITSSEIYTQANGRIARPGQKFTTLIIHIEATAEERRIYHRLKNKEAMQNILLERKTAREAA